MDLLSQFEVIQGGSRGGVVQRTLRQTVLRGIEQDRHVEDENHSHKHKDTIEDGAKRIASKAR